MKNSDLIYLFCDEICEFLKIDTLKREILFSHFTIWKWKDYSDFLKEKEYILYTSMDKVQIVEPYKLIDLYLSEFEKNELYRKSFNFITYKMKSSLAVEFLKHIETKLCLNSLTTKEIRNNYIKEKYFTNTNFIDYTTSVVSSLFMVLANDGKIDENEFKNNQELFKYFKSNCPGLLIKDFNLLSRLSNIEVSHKQKNSLKIEMTEAIRSDERIELSEVKVLQEVLSNVYVCEHLNISLRRLKPLIILKLLLSDNELSKKEIKWFSQKYELSTLINSIEESFLFLDLVTEFPEIFMKNKVFFYKIWNPEDEISSFSSKLFIAWIKRYKKVETKTFVIVMDLLTYGTSKEFKKYLLKIECDEVVKEDLYLIINIVINSTESFELINEFIDIDNIEKVFLSLKSNHSPLRYFSIVQSLMADRKIDSKEYSSLWLSFERAGLSHEFFEEVLYDYSILKLIKYKYDNYFDYLTKQLD